MKTLITLALAATLAACASVGTKFDASPVSTFQPGVTTKEEAIAKLGKPFRSARSNSMGGTNYMWKYAVATPGGITTNDELLLNFDDTGRFTRVMASSGNALQ